MIHLLELLVQIFHFIFKLGAVDFGLGSHKVISQNECTMLHPQRENSEDKGFRPLRERRHAYRNLMLL